MRQQNMRIQDVCDREISELRDLDKYEERARGGIGTVLSLTEIGRDDVVERVPARERLNEGISSTRRVLSSSRDFSTSSMA